MLTEDKPDTFFWGASPCFLLLRTHARTLLIVVKPEVVAMAKRDSLHLRYGRNVALSSVHMLELLPL